MESNNLNLPNISEAFEIGNRFLRRQQVRTNGLTSGTNWSERSLVFDPFIFFWDDDRALIEFPITTHHGGDAGYVIVSSSKDLPPIIEYATTGTRYSNFFLRDLAIYYKAESSLPRKLYYFGYSEVIARIDNADSTKFIRLPRKQSFQTALNHVIRRDPSAYWEKNDVDEQWKRIGGPVEDRFSDFSIVLDYRRPTKYNQPCDSYPRTSRDLSPQNYCAPRCIVGCVPVAWAMLASALKRTHWRQSESIWSGTPDWDIPWGTYNAGSSDPTRSIPVVDSMWKWHQQCETSCEGATASDIDEISKGIWIFKEAWNIDVATMATPDGWKWKALEDPDFEDMRHAIELGQPYLFGGTSDWQQYGVKAQLFTDGTQDGHCTVVYGYETDNKSILICLGWGEAVSDKWVSFYTVSDRKVVYVDEAWPDHSAHGS